MSRNLVASPAWLLFLALAGYIFLVLRDIPREGPPRYLVSEYATALKGRKSSQVHNALLAARHLNGAIVAPGEEFSFNRRVGLWNVENGYVKAPVSFEGSFGEAVGGGVCQTSTTLYNAVLLAGLPVVERHPHAVAPPYVPPGRDAAVAQRALDLRFRNTLAGPIVITAEEWRNTLVVKIFSTQRVDRTVSLRTVFLDCVPPRAYARTVTGGLVPAPINYQAGIYGLPGWTVATYRRICEGGSCVEERVSRDNYTPIHYVLGSRRQYE